MSIKRTLENIKAFIEDYEYEKAIGALKDLASEYGYEESVNEFVDEYSIGYLLQGRMESDFQNWASAACFLAQVEGLNDEYYYLDGYGNLRNVQKDDLECALRDLTRDLASDIKDETITCFKCKKELVLEEDDYIECDECGECFCPECHLKLEDGVYCHTCASELKLV